MEPERFRIFFWQKLAPLIALPVFGVLLLISPVSSGWTATTWRAVAAIAGIAVAIYLWRAWQRSEVMLDDDGLTLYGEGGWQTWPHEKLLKIKQYGKYRARMCYDPDIADQHMHITLDLFRIDDFVDALLDWYAMTTGEELPPADGNHGVEERAA